MRMSVRKDDPGYSPDAFDAKVYLDGRELTECFTADENLGVVWCYVTDENGQVQLNEERTEVLEECLRGDVLIVPHTAG